MTREQAARFAQEWAAAWNAHDLDRVLAHYRDDFEMTSPFIVRLMDEPTGTLKGKEQVGAYWRRALDRMPGLRFDVLDVFAGVDTVVIHYTAILGLRACEWFIFDGAGKIRKAVAHYDRAENRSRLSPCLPLIEGACGRSGWIGDPSRVGSRGRGAIGALPIGLDWQKTRRLLAK